MKKVLTMLLAAVMLISVTSAFAVANQNTAEVEYNVLILYKDKVEATDVDEIGKVKGKVKKKYANFPIVSAKMSPKAISALRKNPKVKTVELDGKVRKSAQTFDWGINAVGAPAAWTAGYTGAGVKIAVIDTGIAPHPDLVIAGGRSFVSYTTSYADDDGHGTHVAGIIGARNNDIGHVGIAHESSLYAVKVLDNTGSGTWSAVISGIDWAVTNDMDIMNLSLGGSSGSSTMEAAINNAVANGTLVVAAAGNSGTATGDTDTVNFPAKYTNAIAVGATTSSGVRASFSSTGPAVDIAAPGASIKSTYLNNGYATLSGTSMATPYVAGNLALLKQANPTATITELRNILQSTATDLGVSGVDTWYGHGLIKAPSTPPTPDTQAPTVPTITGATNVTNTGLRLNWTASTDDRGVSGYEVFRDGTSIGTVVGTATSMNVSGLTASTTYNFTVRAYDAANNFSAQSSPLSVTTAATPPGIATTTTVTIGKTSYTAGNTVSGSVTVRDSSGRTVSSANVQVVVTGPTGNVFSTINGVTSSRGSFSFKFATLSSSTKGTYTVTATSSRTGYTNSTGSRTFTLR